MLGMLSHDFCRPVSQLTTARHYIAPGTVIYASSIYHISFGQSLWDSEIRFCAGGVCLCGSYLLHCHETSVTTDWPTVPCCALRFGMYGIWNIFSFNSEWAPEPRLTLINN